MQYVDVLEERVTQSTADLQAAFEFIKKVRSRLLPALCHLL